jgi:uncharacterized repeat protein (TIGR02543 family)
MKKAIFGFMAILTVFAMIGCSSPSGPSGPGIPDSVEITFDLNYTDAGDGTTVTAASGRLTASQLTTATPTRDDETTDGVTTRYRFLGWNTKADGTGDTVTTATQFYEDASVYAQWDAYDPATRAYVTFDRNDGSVGVNAVFETMAVTLTSGTGTIGSEWKSSLSQGPSRANYTFKGWSTNSSEADPSTFTGGFIAASSVTEDITVYAVWLYSGTGPEPISERFTVMNNAHPLFSFTLPTGKTWGDFATFKVDYRVTDTTDPLRHRIVGNYTTDELNVGRIGVYTPSTEDAAAGRTSSNIAVVGSWPGGTLNRYIQWQKGGDSGGLGTDFGEADVSDNEWFTASFGVRDFSSANTEHNTYAFEEGRRPANGATGTFVYGFGFCSVAGQGQTKLVVYDIANVKLVASDGTEVVGMPLFYKDADNTLYRAFCGQLENLNDDGLYTNTQNGKEGWEILDGAASVVPFKSNYANTTTKIEVSFDLNYPNDDDETDLAPEAKEVMPGERITGDLPEPVKPTTPPDVEDHPELTVWKFLGWFSAAEEGIKIVAGTIYNKAETLYAQWEPSEAMAIVKFNNGGGTGSKADVQISVGTSLTTAQLAKGSLTGPDGKAQFGGWYTVDTAAGGFDYKDYSKLVTTANTFSNITTGDTVYAYWYNAATETTVSGVKVQAKWGAVYDAEEYLIFASGDNNGYIGGNANDTMLTFALADDFVLPDGATSFKATYSFKWIVQPTFTTEQEEAGWTADAAGIWKKKDSQDNGGPSAGSYFSFNVGGGDLTHNNLNQFKADDDYVGISIQINAGDDINNKQRRNGIFAIKITAIEFVE